MPYIDPVKWALDHVSPKERSFNDNVNSPVASFHSDVFVRAYALGPPRQLLTSKFLDEAISRYNYEEVVKSWMDNKELFGSTPTNAYPISWFREPFSLLVAMLCRLYGSASCTMFQAKWVPVAQHVLFIGDSFNWAQVLSFNLKYEIEKYQKTPSNQKSTFYMSGFVMDALCATSPFSALNWNWSENSPPYTYIVLICGRTTSFLESTRFATCFLGRCITKFSRLMI